jgi:hypothetical protein
MKTGIPRCSTVASAMLPLPRPAPERIRSRTQSWTPPKLHDPAHSLFVLPSLPMWQHPRIQPLPPPWPCHGPRSPLGQVQTSTRCSSRPAHRQATM